MGLRESVSSTLYSMLSSFYNNRRLNQASKCDFSWGIKDCDEIFAGMEDASRRASLERPMFSSRLPHRLR